MLGGFLFVPVRVFQIITLIPIIGMLGYFVNIYNNANQLTPLSILLLFIVSVLACAWALVTVLSISSLHRNAYPVAFIDILFLGAFIASVYELRGIANANCSNSSGGPYANSGDYSLTVGYNPINVDVNKQCAMLKSSWAFGIIECLLFPLSALIVFLMHRRGETVVVSEKVGHRSRRGHSGHRRSSSSRRQYYV